MKKQQHSLPTIVGLVLLVIGVVIGVFFVQTRQTFNLSAAPGEIPKGVRITNVTDTSFTVSWTTDKKIAGYIDSGKNRSLGTLTQSRDGVASNIHFSKVEGLSPSTTYFFKIGSGQNTYAQDDNEPYDVKTGPKLANKTSNDIVFGKVQSTSKAPVDSVLYLTLPGAAPLSTVVDKSGNWTINLSAARTVNLSAYATYNKQTVLEILIASSNNQTTTAKVKFEGARPVPPMVVGKNYNLTDSKALEYGALPQSDIELTGAGGPAGTTTPTPTKKLTPTPTVKPTATPKPTVTPTPTTKPVGGTSVTTPTPTPTATPTAKPTISAATSSATLPAAGGLTPTIAASIMGLSLLVVGIVIPKTFGLL